MAKKGPKASKNNIENRGAAAKLKEINGEQIKPVMYKGGTLNHGSYIAAAFVGTGKLVVDPSGKPLPFSKIVSN